MYKTVQFLLLTYVGCSCFGVYIVDPIRSVSLFKLYSFVMLVAPAAMSLDFFVSFVLFSG